MTSFDPAHRQGEYAVRMEWGATGAAAVAADVCVVVDVLSFTTTLTVALERGITVFPYAWNDSGAPAYAAARDAVLAVGRVEARAAGSSGAGSGSGSSVSLAPSSMLTASDVERVVLPSPNGSTIAFALASSGAQVVAASLRNRAAVGRWLARTVSARRSVAVIAAGERWPDGSLRPAVEDLWGAGSVVAALADLGVGGLSPEARVVEAAFRAAAPRLGALLADCSSGRELVAAGFPDDIDLAAQLDVSDVVPVLEGEAFRSAV